MYMSYMMVSKRYKSYRSIWASFNRKGRFFSHET